LADAILNAWTLGEPARTKDNAVIAFPKGAEREMIIEYRNHHDGRGCVVWIDNTVVTIAAAKKMEITFPSVREAMAYVLTTGVEDNEQIMIIEGNEHVDLVADVPFVTIDEVSEEPMPIGF
jgi:hypothetical protein